MRRVDRDWLIRRLRSYLLQLTDDDHSLCQVAAERNLFCRGFGRLSTPEIRETYDFLSATHPRADRRQLTELANRWELGRQERCHAALACDAALQERDTCLGWDEFDDRELAGFYREWFGETVLITGSTNTPHKGDQRS